MENFLELVKIVYIQKFRFRFLFIKLIRGWSLLWMKRDRERWSFLNLINFYASFLFWLFKSTVQRCVMNILTPYILMQNFFAWNFGWTTRKLSNFTNTYVCDENFTWKHGNLYRFRFLFYIVISSIFRE